MKPNKNRYRVIIVTHAPTNNRHVRNIYAETWVKACWIAAREAYPFGWRWIITQLSERNSITFVGIGHA